MSTLTKTATYSEIDVAKVVRRFTADLVMIADSTGAIALDTAEEYAHDVEMLAQNGYLRTVDLTLLSYGEEKRATQYTVDTDAGALTPSRPGGVLWPRVASPDLRIVLSYTSAYDDAARRKMGEKLRISWTPTNADTSHSSLNHCGGRDYASNSYGLQRKDWI